MARPEQRLAYLLKVVAATERNHFEVAMGAALKSINSKTPPSRGERTELAAADAAWKTANTELANYQSNETLLTLFLAPKDFNPGV